MIAKLNAYGFNERSLKFLHDYLSHWWHRTKINKQFSSWQELIQRARQGSVLGSLLLNNIPLNVLFILLNLTCFWKCLGKNWKNENLGKYEAETRNLSFDEYIVSLCRKAWKKLSILGRLSNFRCTNKKIV